MEEDWTMQDHKEIFLKCIWSRIAKGCEHFPIFNVSNLYPYHADESSQTTTQEKYNQQVPWEAQLPKVTPIVIEIILDKRMSKKTRGREYYEYHIKWKNRPIKDSTWMTATMLQKSGVTVEYLMDRSPWIIFFTWEFDAGASPQKSSYVKIVK